MCALYCGCRVGPMPLLLSLKKLYFYHLKKNQTRLIWALLILLSLLLISPRITAPVQGRHAWAMADHFALSLGFLDNGFDFFHPQTYCLNPQFAPEKSTEKTTAFWSVFPKSPKGITAVDFPIHPYIVAGIMKLLDTRSPSIYRMYMLFLSLVGLFYLFKTIFLATHSFAKGLFVILFVFLAPTYGYYAVGFLPSAAALSLLFIAAYHFTNYLKTQRFQSYLFALLLITLAALTRLPFVIYLLGLFCSYGLKGFWQKKGFVKELVGASIGIGTVLLYFVYNKAILSANYGSNFLNYPLYPKTLKDFLEVLFGVFYYESWRYLTLIHYLFLGLLVLFVLKNSALITITKKHQFSIGFLGIVTLGVSFYALLMGLQFVAHDYYILDTFFPILVFWLISFASWDKKIKLRNYKKQLLLMGVLAFALNRLVLAYGYDAREKSPLEKTRRNFENSHAILDSLQVSKQAKILLLDAYSPNLAFIGMQRSGFCVMQPSYESLQRALSWEYDYIVTQNFSFREKVLKNCPKFKERTTVYFSNDKFTIHLKK